jgi:RNA polymerase sigma-70 factor (ECF subfamily)
MNSDDYDLVKECLKGDKKSFEEIVEKYYKTIFRLSFRITRDHDNAEEITQSAFIKAYENLNSYDCKYKFFSWLYRITVNEAINFSKREKRTEEISERISTDEGSPDKIYDEMELKKKIHDAIMQLDLLYRLPIVLKHLFDYSYKELSYVLDVPEKTVKSRLFTGRQLLKDILVNNRV